MLRLIGIDSQLALVKNKLATPPIGKLSEVEQYDTLVMRFATDQGARWMTVRDRFAPYGYIPAELRDQPAIVLIPAMPRDTLRAQGSVDGASYEGTAALHNDGSAAMDVAVTFSGNRAIAWRNALDRIPEARLYDFVERELIAPAFDGAHVQEVHIDGAAAIDQPLVVRLRAEAPRLAKSARAGLTLRPPFAPSLAHLASLPARHTPLLRSTSFHTEVRIQVSLPDSAAMASDVARGELRFGDALVTSKDVVRGHAIDFDRVIELPAGRVQAGDEYARWQKFVRDADTLLTREVSLTAPSKDR